MNLFTVLQITRTEFVRFYLRNLPLLLINENLLQINNTKRKGKSIVCIIALLLKFHPHKCHSMNSFRRGRTDLLVLTEIDKC